MRHLACVILAVCATALWPVGASAQNLVLNGSFESGPTGVVFAGGSIGAWDVYDGNVDHLGLWPQDGALGLDMNGNSAGSIRQTISTIPGKTYLLTFWVAANSHNDGYNSRTLTVSVDGDESTFTVQRQASVIYERRCLAFVATGGQTILSFAGDYSQGASGPALDNVEVRAVDSPSLILNGGFEDTPYPGGPFVELPAGSTAIAPWSISAMVPDTGRQPVDWIGSYWAPSEGTKSLELNGNFQAGAISQTFGTEPGESYFVTFDLSKHTVPGLFVEVRVTAGSQTRIFSHTDNNGSPFGMIWRTHAMCFEATGSVTTITFETLNGNSNVGTVLDNVMVRALPPRVIAVDIDIKPGSDRNPVNPKSKGVLPVAILTTDDFDAADVDVSSVRFGPNEVGEAHGRQHLEDVDNDGDLDLVLHFKGHGIAAGDTEATLVGLTADGQEIVGTDIVTTVGKARKVAVFPVPANPTTTISYTLVEGSPVRISIYNTLGQIVRTLVNQQQGAGAYSIRWDANDASGRGVTSGTYLINMEFGNERIVKKFTLLK